MLHLDSAQGRRVGIGLVTLTTLCFATLDASAKWLIQTLPVLEVVWLRFLFHTLLTSALLAPLYGRDMLRLRRPGLHLLRALMLASMTVLNFWALQYLQLAETGAIQFSVPLLIALFSAWWLGERLDWRRWLAILGRIRRRVAGDSARHAGFSSGDPAVGAERRALCRLQHAGAQHGSHRVTCRHADVGPGRDRRAGSVCAGAVANAADAGGLGAADRLRAVWRFGHFFVAQAHRYASAATLGPFLYQQILYMTLWGWLLFGQVPDAPVLIGAAIVVASGLALLWIEMRRSA